VVEAEVVMPAVLKEDSQVVLVVVEEVINLPMEQLEQAIVLPQVPLKDIVVEQAMKYGLTQVGLK
tara:strand:+ start:317 stop:511 length:195 start_codon:yes stop_codon:yes gene_type:complete